MKFGFALALIALCIMIGVMGIVADREATERVVPMLAIAIPLIALSVVVTVGGIVVTYRNPRIYQKSILTRVALALNVISAFLVWLSVLLLRDHELGLERLWSTNNLHKIGRALLAYASDRGVLPPPAIFDGQGKPLLSWRVMILPCLEQEKLYKEFHINEPWDSPHNLRLLERMPEVYAAPKEHGTLGRTHYQVFVGRSTPFEGAEGIRLDAFPDGTDKTILLVEAGAAVPWTKPEELTYEKDGPLPSLGFRRKDVFEFMVILADGSIERLWEPSERTIRAYVTRNAGDTADAKD